jgi:hypothetical protein
MFMLARLVLVVLSLTLVLLAGAARADGGGGKGGPSPGVLLGWNGVPAIDGKVRYVALTAGTDTLVAAVRVRGGTVLRHAKVSGSFGVPFVAFDGSTAGLAHDGRTLVLSSFPAQPSTRAVSRFAVLSAKSLRLRHLITLRGAWSFDALSPDGKKLYLVEYVAGRDARYRVRAYDLERGRLVREAVVDPRQGGRSMSGEPVTRLSGPGGVWEYTLYRKPGGLPFIHALNTNTAKALCIELPWRGSQNALWNVRMTMRPDGRMLELRQPRVGSLAVVDTRQFVVHAHAHPRA